MTKARTNDITLPVALKTIHDHIVRDNPNATVTTKSMRVKLRVAMRDDHSHNASWLFTTKAEYDRVRSMFDAKYAASIAKPAKAPRKPRTPKPAIVADAAPVEA